MAGISRALSHVVTLDGNAMPYVLEYHWSTGYDLSVGEASITVAAWTGLGTYYDEVAIVVDGSTRWRGLYVQKDYNLFPRAVTVACRDPLFLADRFQVTTVSEEGVLLADLGGPQSDESLVSVVLTAAGLESYLGTISGTGTILGTVAPEEFTWRPQESALAFVQRIDQISLGYRTFWNGTDIVRQQISSRPSGSASKTFTEGVDIASGSASRTVMESYNAVRIGGYAVGDFADPRVWYQAESNPFQSESNPRVFNFTSAMIERRAEVSPGEGISCEAVAGYFLGELNRELVKVQLFSPRSDVTVPGEIHLVQGPGGTADRLGTGENLWTQRVDGSLAQSGAFGHGLTYVGGGA